MRKVVFSVLAILVFSGLSAQTLKDVVNPETPMTWLGLDFSLLKVVADQDAWTGKSPKEMFKAWNELMINEQNKFNVAEVLDRDQVKFALEVTMDHNAGLSDNNIFIPQSLPENLAKVGDVPAVIKSYDFKGNTGIGVMFVAESFDKPALKGNWWITFVNMDTKEIIYIQKLSESAAGFGLRNFWASTVYNSLKQIKSTEFKKWKKSVKK